MSALRIVRKLITYRTKLLVTMMVLVCAISALTLYFVESRAIANLEHQLQQEFETGLAALHQSQQVRHAAILEHCRALVKKSRIHAALEDNALDLLYPSAREELRDIMENPREAPSSNLRGLSAKFYRFLDRDGHVISPNTSFNIGRLSTKEEAQLSLTRTPLTPQLGYLERENSPSGEELYEVIAMPIVSTETGEVIATLVLGFVPMQLDSLTPRSKLRSGIYLGGKLYISSLSARENADLAAALASTVEPSSISSPLRVNVESTPHLLFHTTLNADSLFPTAQEVCIFSLADFLDRRKEIRLQVLAGGLFVLLGGFLVSRVVANRFSRPVEDLARESADNKNLRVQAEAALEATSRELQRSIRFSADASHQLKTPVTVLRAGLEELLARPHLSPKDCEELAALVHQTYRLSGVIEDLLLLSKVEAGRLSIQFAPVNLSLLIDGWLDDLSALPDPLQLTAETDVPPDTYIQGEQRYVTLVLQNLLENARKYNRVDGRVKITVRTDHDSGFVVMTIGNTGQAIAPEAQEHIFERFHRGTAGENVPGYGLGLNLAQELARIHRGDLRLLRSADDWTEFEVKFRSAPKPSPAAVK
ncbi:MAG: HAMP domain-containing sensor histidine kinase [Nibricoccus sp.]